MVLWMTWWITHVTRLRTRTDEWRLILEWWKIKVETQEQSIHLEMESKRYSTESANCCTHQRDAEGDEVNGQTSHGDAAAAAAADSDAGWTTQDSAPQYKNEAEHRLIRVVTGCLDNLPPQQSKIVRIFTSSTFTGQLLLGLCYIYTLNHHGQGISHFTRIKSAVYVARW